MNNEQVVIETAPKLSSNNKKNLVGDVVCGCYFCLTIFRSSAITDWVDNGETALCPNCGIDTVLPDVANPFLLMQAKEKWFTGQSKEKNLGATLPKKSVVPNLKPCAFCGGRAKWGTEPNSPEIVCTICHVRVDTVAHSFVNAVSLDEKRKVIAKKWNTRYEPNE